MEQPASIAVGVAGWSYPDWTGIVYPRLGRQTLRLTAGLVDCIEINSTFYRPPEPDIVRDWIRQVQGKKGFFFSAKLHQKFTHEGQIDSALVCQFKSGLEPLLEAGMLRCLLMQFRHDFAATPDNRRYMGKLIEQFQEMGPIVVELRHSSWLQPAFRAELEQPGISVCALDYPAGPDFLDFDVRSTSAGYMRLHGRNTAAWFTKSTRDERYDYYYSTEELKEIAARILQLASRGQTYTVIANNHYKGAAVANALELRFLLTGLKQVIPDRLLARYPSLSRMALSSGLFDESAG